YRELHSCATRRSSDLVRRFALTHKPNKLALLWPSPNRAQPARRCYLCEPHNGCQCHNFLLYTNNIYNTCHFILEQSFQESSPGTADGEGNSSWSGKFRRWQHSSDGADSQAISGSRSRSEERRVGKECRS